MDQNPASQITTPQGQPVQPQPPTPTAKNNLYVILSIILVIVIVALLIYAASVYINQRSNKYGNTSPKLSPVALSPTQAPQLMATYTNTQYGFQLHYPAKGFVGTNKQIPNKNNLTYSYTIGTCGSHISLAPTQDASYLAIINVESFFAIYVKAFNGTLADYTNTMHPGQNRSNGYIYTPIDSKNADEAVSVSTPPNVIASPGPLAIYRKGNKIISINSFQNSPTITACHLDGGPVFQPDQWPGLTSDEYTSTYNTYYKNWTIPQSLTF